MRAQKIQSQDPIIHFYADESWIEIEGKNHLMMGAIGVSDTGTIAIGVVDLKKDFGLPPLKEIKWNSGKTLSEEQRHGISQGMLSIIRNCKGFITSYCFIRSSSTARGTQWLAIRFLSIKTWSRMKEVLSGGCRIGDPRLIGIQILDSATDQLIQCADFFVGAYRIAMRQILGDAPTKIIKLPLRAMNLKTGPYPIM